MQMSLGKVGLMLAFCSILYYSCTQAPDFADAPEISFISMSKNSMVQNINNVDSLFLTISFRDGDGDLGSLQNNGSENIILVDSRTGIIADRYKVPIIPIAGTQKGIEGEITIKVFTTCCRFEDANPCASPPNVPTNELFYEIYMIDDSGNESNRVNSSFLSFLLSHCGKVSKTLDC